VDHLGQTHNYMTTGLTPDSGLYNSPECTSNSATSNSN